MASILSCVLDYDPEPAGGTERQARLQADELARRGHRVTVVCRGLGGARSGPVGDVWVDRLRTGRALPGRVFHYVRLALYLARRVRDHDVVHVHHANLQADVAVAIGRTLGRPVILKLAGTGPGAEIERLRWLRRWTGHAALRRASAVLISNPAMAAELVGVGVQPGRIVRIPNGVDPTIAAPVAPEARAAARSALGLPAEAIVVLSLGRFAEEKGTADLLSAWAPLRADPGLALLLVGRTAGLRPLIPTPGGNLHVVPWLADPGIALRAADLFVLASHGEGMSNALIEALAAGLPVVVTPVGAGPDRVREHGAGLVVPVGDPAALRAAILELACDPERRGAAGRAGPAAVADLSIARVVDRIEALYGRLSRVT